MKNTNFALLALAALALLWGSGRADADALMECNSQKLASTQGKAVLYRCGGERTLELPRCRGAIRLQGAAQPSSVPRFYLRGQGLKNCNGVTVEGSGQVASYVLTENSVAIPNRFFTAHTLKLHFNDSARNPGGRLGGEIVDMVHVELKILEGAGNSPAGTRSRFEVRVE